MLRVNDLVVRYGAATAIDGVSMTVERGELVALIGPNGAGKSTLVNAICGLVPISSGSIDVDGRVAQVPEGRQMFADLSVEDNLRLGAWTAGQRDPELAFDVLPDLRGLRRQRAGTLSGGQQQMVAIGRALMAQPDLLVIDELSLGLAPVIVSSLAHHLERLCHEKGVTVLLIEQEVGLALRIASRAYVLETGRIVAEGATTGADLMRVRAAYLSGLRPGTGAA